MIHESYALNEPSSLVIPCTIELIGHQADSFMAAARSRGIHEGELLHRLINVICRDDMIAAVLDD